ncbi:MAG TPA: hypothetical protein VF719_01625 [Abditibacteriaceae bacterium]|jgi:hypothetical protein
MTRIYTRFGVLFLFVLGFIGGAIQNAAAQPNVAPRTFWDGEKQGKFVTALSAGTAQQFWVGTEDNGVWRYDSAAPAGTRWTQFTTADGLGDDNGYALALDKQGRVWVGHLNHGVSVWNGERWQNYGVLSGLQTRLGPLGERIFDIAVCPTDGAVWIAHSAGLSRYAETEKNWRHFSREDGLPADQFSSLAFDAKGKLYGGTQCEGLAIASPEDNYKTWRSVRGAAQLTTSATGEGLPSDLINDVLVAQDGAIYVATSNGMGWSRDNGQTWDYLRGSNWIAKHEGRYKPPALAGEQTAQTLLSEDFVTCLAEDGERNLWVGFRQAGYSVLDVENNRVLYNGEMDGLGANDDTITSILPDSPLGALLGRYKDNAGGVALSQHVRGETTLPVGAAQVAELPAADRPPTPEEFAARLKQFEGAAALEVGGGVFLGDDWSTQGNWLGRYGDEHFNLCGMNGMGTWNQENAATPLFTSKLRTGPHTDNGSTRAVYSYITWLRSDLRRVLFAPVLGYRRMAENNDGSWQDKYPLTYEGPDLWMSFQVPEGVHRASFYFFNKDGHSGPNRHRDYLLELKAFVEDPIAAETAPTLARARVPRFWGGAYKSFAVRGPGKFMVKIGRAHSHVVILQGLFIDRLGAPAPENTETVGRKLVGLLELPAGAPLPTLLASPVAPPAADGESANLAAARSAWSALDSSVSATALTARALRISALRAATEGPQNAKWGEAWRRQLGLWAGDDEAQFNALAGDFLKVRQAVEDEMKAARERAEKEEERRKAAAAK